MSEKYGAYFGDNDSSIRMRNLSSSDFDLISDEENYDYFKTESRAQKAAAKANTTGAKKQAFSSSQGNSADKKTTKSTNSKTGQGTPESKNKKSANKNSSQKDKKKAQKKTNTQKSTKAQSTQSAQKQKKQSTTAQKQKKSNKARVEERPISQGREATPIMEDEKYVPSERERKRSAKTRKEYVRLLNSGKTHDQARRIIAKRKRRFRALEKFLSAFLVFAFVFTLAFTYCYYDGAEIKKIDFEGESDYTQEEILEVAGISKGQHMLTIHEGKINEKLTTSLPLISKVKLKYNFPETLVLDIISTKAEILIKNASGYICIDKTGKVVSLKKQKQQKDQFLVTGMKGAEAAVGEIYRVIVPEVLEEEDEKYTKERLEKELEKRKYEILIEIVKYLREYKLSPCKIDMSNIEDIQIVYNSKIRIYLGDSSRIQNKIYAAQDLKEKNKNDSDKAYIDVSDPAYNLYKGSTMEK